VQADAQRYLETLDTDGQGLLPGSNVLEEAVLDAMLHSATACEWCLGNIEGTDFYWEAHQTIFAAVQAIWSEQGVVDIALCAAKLREWNKLEACGGVEYLRAMGLGDAYTENPAVVRTYTETLRAYRVQRDIARLTTDLRDAIESKPGDPHAVIQKLQTATDALCRRLQFGRGAEAMCDIAGPVLDEIDTERRRPFEVRGLRCGIPELDNPFGGLGDQALVLILGLSGYGKTTLAGQYVFQTAIDSLEKPDAGELVVYVIEGTLKRFLRRFLSWQAQVPMNHLKPGGDAMGGEETRIRIAAARKDIERAPMHVCDGMNRLDEIETDIRNHAMRGPLQGVMIDHAQLFAREGDNRVAQLEDAATRLQILADDIKAPILLLSQVTVNDGETYAKHAKGLFEACSLVLQLDRGDPGQTQEEKRRSEKLWVLNSKARDDDPIAPVELRAVWQYKRLYGLNDWSQMRQAEAVQDGRY